ncbi:MAG: PmoA family protein [Planctomycetaceae bacterium]|nr:PmoA family protein [Planctomycetaceae bacterium]
MANDYRIPRCQALPIAGHQVQFLIDGQERLRWNFDPSYPRPFFYPLIGPGGVSLTRMGHPGAPNHDHHQSVWFAHHKVLGIDFWGNTGDARIRQQEWLAYVDGDAEAVMAVRLGWFDGHDPRALLTQDVVAAVRPGPERETFLEIQTTLTPTADELELGKTNFGLLAVRVAKSLSAYFGGGQIVDSEGRAGEPAIFGQQARWMDYSGPATPDTTEGITFFDHPANPGHPCHWHVREDGWMGASLCFAEPRLLQKLQPLTLRYLLHLHRSGADQARSATVFAEFAASAAFLVERSSTRHLMHSVRRQQAATP